MFGMGSDRKKTKVAKYTFDLEQELQDPGKMRAVKEQIDERVMQLKTLLREGKDKKEFDKAQSLLHAYLAMEKVIKRINRKAF